jgi:hypothetical protein
MSIIFEVKCKSCKYIRHFPDCLMIAVDDEGKEHNCVHPCEYRTIERIEKETGKSHDVLRKMGQIYIGQPLLCNSCGEISYYSDASIDGIDLHRNNSHITGFFCKQCNQNNLYLPFPLSVPPKSLLSSTRHEEYDVRWLLILLLSKVLPWILLVIVIAKILSLSLFVSIIIILPTILLATTFYIWLEYMNNTSPERKYWKTIPCPQCQKLKLSFYFRGTS